MELKKRDIINEREYAKKNEVSKNEVKNTIPKKWLVASSIGIVTLLYSNPSSIFGHIGVVFGCIKSVTVNYSQTWHAWNTFSNLLPFISYGTTCAFILVLTAFLISFFIEYFKKDFDKKVFLTNNKILFFSIVLSMLISVLSTRTHQLLDNWILDMNIPQFYEGGEKILTLWNYGKLENRHYYTFDELNKLREDIIQINGDTLKDVYFEMILLTDDGTIDILDDAAFNKYVSNEVWYGEVEYGNNNRVTIKISKPNV